MRIGHGYDVHRYAEGRELIIGGVRIPWEKGLDGHSDADVLTHAIMDALLGAAGQGDIGQHFPDNDPKYKGADSIVLLHEVSAILGKLGYSVSNIDSTIVAQKPKMMSYLGEMKKNIANALDIEVGQVNIKATTEEGLGFTGTLQGVAAHAVVLIDNAQ